MDRKSVYEHTEPMLVDDEIAKQYALAASHYNAMATTQGWIGVPATLHDALYKTHHGEQDIRSAVDNTKDIMNALANGLVSLMLICRMRQQFGSIPVVTKPLTCPGCGWSTNAVAKTVSCKLGIGCLCEGGG